MFGQAGTVPASPANDVTVDVFQWSGPTAWHFVTVPEPTSDEIAARMEGFMRGFGTVRVHLELAEQHH